MILRPRAWVTLAIAVVAAMPALRASSPPSDDAETITINSGTVFQTMRGWEVTPSGMFLPNFSKFQDRLITKGVDLGLNRFRLEVRAGSENPTDYYAQWRAAGYPPGDNGGPGDLWRGHRYETINDNSNPNAVNSSAFHWTEVDEMIGWFVTPMRAKLAAQAESLWVNLCYVAFTTQNTSGQPYIHTDPNEYAEYMLALFQHLQTTYGWVPDSIEMVLEPDNVPQWNGLLLGQALVAAGNRLAANGFHPEFIAPSTTGILNGVQMIDQMLTVPGVLTYLKELSYHRYAQNEPANIAAYATRGMNNNLATSMLEWWTDANTPATLHEDLTLGRVSAWQPKTLSGLFTVDTNSGSVTTTLNTAYFRQYMHYIRRGAVRVEAASSGTSAPLAFINPGNRYVVVVSTTGAKTLTVENLPAGSYGVHYTTDSQIDKDAGTKTVGSNGTLTTNIPAAGYLTVFNTSGTSEPPPGPPPPPVPPPGPPEPPKSPGSPGPSAPPTASRRSRPPSAPAQGVAVPRKAKATTSTAALPARVATVPPPLSPAPPPPETPAGVPSPILLVVPRLAPRLDDASQSDSRASWHHLQLLDARGEADIDLAWIEWFDGQFWIVTVARTIK